MTKIDDIINDMVKRSMLNGKPNLRAEFDGENIGLYNEQDKIGGYRTQSGLSKFQNKGATYLGDRGPIPEGEWLLKYSDLQTDNRPYSSDMSSWGRNRAKITPLMSSDDRFGRDGFYLHGSYNGLETNGCLKMGLNMDHFVRFWNKYKHDIPLTVKYKKDFGRK